MATISGPLTNDHGPTIIMCTNSLLKNILDQNISVYHKTGISWKILGRGLLLLSRKAVQCAIWKLFASHSTSSSCLLSYLDINFCGDQIFRTNVNSV